MGRWRCAGFVLVLAMVASACTSGDGDTSSIEGSAGDASAVSADSGNEFCDILAEQSAQMNARVAEADDSLGSQMAMILANVSDFTRLLRRLEDVAPSELAVDMQVVVELWEEQADAVGRIASDPIGALASQAVLAVTSGASVEAVEAYAVSECGMPLFGLSAIGQARQSQCSALSVDRTLPGREPFWELLNDTAAVDPFVQVITDLMPVSEDVAGAGQELLDAVAGLDPQPRWAAEAIGRLNFEGGDGTELLEEFEEAVAQACGEGAFSDDVVARTGGFVPRRLGSTVEVGGAYFGTACVSYRGGSGGSFIANPQLGLPLVNVFFCGREELVVVDLEDGGVRRFDVDGTMHPNGFVIAGDRIVWLETSEKPAEGLNPLLTSLTLRILPLDGGDEVAIPIIVDSAQSLGGQRGEVLYAWRDRIVTIEPGAEDPEDVSVLLRDGSGAEVARFGPEQLDEASGLTFPDVIATNLMMVEGRRGDMLLDLDSGSLLEPDADDFRVYANEVCSDRAWVRYSSGDVGGVAVHTSDGAPNLVPVVSSVREDLYDVTIVRPGVLIADVGTGTSDMVGVAADGTELWRIPSEVGSAEVVGGWVLITNRSDERIVVDPLTGTEADVDAGLRRVLLALADDELSPAVYDAVSDTMILLDGRTATVESASAICPA